MPPCYVSRAEVSDYEPFMFGDDAVIEGSPNGRVQWLRQDPSGSPMAGIYVGEPGAVRYTWEANETVYVLEGCVRIEFEGGESVELKPGDAASFSKGQCAVWRFLTPFKEFFVYS